MDSKSIRTIGNQRVVEIFWTESPTEIYGYIPPGTSGVMRPFGRHLKDYVKNFSIGLYSLLKHHLQLQEIVVVNGGHIHYAALDLPEDQTRKDKEEKLKAMVNKTLSEQAGVTLEYQPGRLSATYEHQAVKRTIGIKYISLQEYLNTYDWSGEFTKTEVKAWLEDDGIKRS